MFLIRTERNKHKSLAVIQCRNIFEHFRLPCMLPYAMTHILVRQTVKCKRQSGMNPFFYNIPVDSLFSHFLFYPHFLFITLLTTRTEDTSLPVEVNTSTFHT